MRAEFCTLAILVMLTPALSQAGKGYRPYLKTKKPPAELIAALDASYAKARKAAREHLSHPHVTLVHSDGRYVYNTVTDKGGGMMIDDRVTYWLPDGAKLIEFQFSMDLTPDGDDESRARVATETVIREYFIKQGFLPLAKKHAVEDLRDVFLADRAKGFLLKLKWKGRRYALHMQEPVLDSEERSCPSGKVTGVVPVPKGVVVSFQPPDTVLDAETGPARNCTRTNGAAFVSLTGDVPQVTYRGKTTAMRAE